MASRNIAPPLPVKHPDFIYYETEPLNGAPPPFLARGEFITPFDLFYIRSHGDVPELDGTEYRLDLFHNRRLTRAAMRLRRKPKRFRRLR